MMSENNFEDKKLEAYAWDEFFDRNPMYQTEERCLEALRISHLYLMFIVKECQTEKVLYEAAKQKCYVSDFKRLWNDLELEIIRYNPTSFIGIVTCFNHLRDRVVTEKTPEVSVMKYPTLDKEKESHTENLTIFWLNILLPNFENNLHDSVLDAFKTKNLIHQLFLHGHINKQIFSDWFIKELNRLKLHYPNIINRILE